MENVFVIFHLLGVALGVGGALISHSMFSSALRDMKISKTEMRFLRLGSSMVWIGLVILFISGYLLFSLDQDKYLNSDKFLAKMTVVAVILGNGIFLHLSLIPYLKSHVGSYLPASRRFMRKRPLLFISGAISLVSWLTALVLGAVHQVPWSYGEIMSMYLLILIGVALVINLFGRYLLPASQAKKK